MNPLRANAGAVKESAISKLKKSPVSRRSEVRKEFVRRMDQLGFYWLEILAAWKYVVEEAK